MVSNTGAERLGLTAVQCTTTIDKLYLLFAVHFRLRPMDQSNPKTLFPSTSAITYWQFEAEDRSLEGNYRCPNYYLLS